MLELHNIDSDQVFAGLRLRIGVVGCDKKKSSVHDSSAGKHGCHERIVTRAINEGDVSD
jgi:hypothetical protein